MSRRRTERIEVPMHAPNETLDITVVIPVYEERDSIGELVERILAVAQEHPLPISEVLLVDDGSRDDTWSVMQALAARLPLVRAVRLRRNFGKAAALDVGIRLSQGAAIVTMDADLQDDPEELPRFYEKLREGYDVISGWKKDRKDPVTKVWPSQLFNKVTAFASGLPLHDFNCGYKAYRREVFNTVQLYGDLHRYVPLLANSLGYRIGEITVRHHPRRFGRSKYGFNRFLRGFLDLLTVLTLTRFAHRPGHLFGGIGSGFLAAGGAMLGYLVLLKLFTGADIGHRPLLLFGVMFVIIAIQLILYGMLSELINNRTRNIAPEDLIREQTPADRPAP